jgi:two-component system, NarL family, nitrate/nitrite response regulator NarL
MGEAAPTVAAPLRVLVADDHEESGLLTANVLSESGQPFEIVARARDGLEALALVEAYDPDVILIDLHMPRLGGVETIAELRRRGCRAAIVLVTASNQPGDVASAFVAGADSYVGKCCVVDLLVPEILAAVAWRRGGEC